MQQNDKKSLLMLLSAMLIYGTIGIFRRYIPLSSGALACFRGAAGTIFLVIAAKLQKKKIFHPIGARKRLMLMLSGAVMGLNWILLFEAYRFTSVAAATLCYYMEPTIVMLAAPLLFREKMTPRKACCALLSVIGMLLVSGILETGISSLAEIKGILFGLAAAVLYSVVVIMNKKMPGIDAYEKTILQLSSASIVLSPYLLRASADLNGPMNPLAIVMLLVVGLVHTGFAYALYFGSMDGLKAQTVAIFSYLDPITALILSALILGEHLSILGLLGAVLIIGSALFSEITLPRRKPRTA